MALSSLNVVLNSLRLTNFNLDPGYGTETKAVPVKLTLETFYAGG